MVTHEVRFVWAHCDMVIFLDLYLGTHTQVSVCYDCDSLEMRPHVIDVSDGMMKCENVKLDYK